MIEEQDQPCDEQRERQAEAKDPVTTSSASSSFFEQRPRRSGAGIFNLSPSGSTLVENRHEADGPWRAKVSRQALDDLDDLVTAIALQPAELDELADSFDDSALLGRAGNGDPTPTLEIEKPLIPKYVEGPQDGVLVHPEHGGKVLGKWKALSRACFALRDRPADLRCHLIVEGHRFRTVDGD
jgi:hypothetical protein